MTFPPCGCCPYCGALPGHQNPPTGQVWQHQHSPVREPMALLSGPEGAAYYEWLRAGRPAVHDAPETPDDQQ